MKVPRVLKWLLIGVPALLVLMCIGAISAVPIDIAANLLFGWVAFAVRVIPGVRVSASGLISAAFCFVLLVVLGHRTAQWLWRQTRDLSSVDWRLRWTLSILCIVVTMFVAGIGVVGATHQTGWLLKSDKPLVHISVNANRINCGSNLRQIGQAIQLFANDHEGRLPDSLPEMLSSIDITPEVFCCPASDDEKVKGDTPPEQIANMREKNCSYIYHGRGLRFPLAPDLPIACEPLVNHEDAGMNILFADGRVEWLDPKQAAVVMRSGAR